MISGYLTGNLNGFLVNATSSGDETWQMISEETSVCSLHQSIYIYPINPIYLLVKYTVFFVGQLATFMDHKSSWILWMNLESEGTFSIANC